MECRDYRKYFRPFWDGELDHVERRALLQHIDSCKACAEELKVQYMLREGMRRLEYGGTLDLVTDYGKVMEEARHRTSVERAAYIMLPLIALSAIVISFLIILGGIVI